MNYDKSYLSSIAYRFMWYTDGYCDFLLLNEKNGIVCCCATWQTTKLPRLGNRVASIFQIASNKKCPLATNNHTPATKFRLFPLYCDTCHINQRWVLNNMAKFYTEVSTKNKNYRKSLQNRPKNKELPTNFAKAKNLIGVGNKSFATYTFKNQKVRF